MGRDFYGQCRGRATWSSLAVPTSTSGILCYVVLSCASSGRGPGSGRGYHLRSSGRPRSSEGPSGSSRVRGTFSSSGNGQAPAPGDRQAQAVARVLLGSLTHTCAMQSRHLPVVTHTRLHSPDRHKKVLFSSSRLVSQPCKLALGC